ncbi:type 1 glutamine amidotransferase [Hoeflea sp. TYP-13]|uniref:type 1 glutamine amidotransferase n=1 Tax=Hoeflea sp. TYP-13 TaxID=3230023 RepID=UPI0034C61C5E
MRIAKLLADTDDTILSQNHPDDGQKFHRLLSQHRPGWYYETISIKDNIFPQSVDDYDGYVITGSPSSVNDPDAWIANLKDFIRELDVKRKPTIGACFGHQAIAAALGGRVGKNPGGWGLGITSTRFTRHVDWMDPAHEELALYSAHSEQVLELPQGAIVLGSNAIAPVGAFSIGEHIFTTQHHPEITPDYMNDLVDVVAEFVPPETIARARSSMNGKAEGDKFAGWMVRFFEQPR